MPPLPWTRGQYRTYGQLHVMTSRLQLARYRDLPRFLRWTSRIRKQLGSDPSCAGYTLDARPLQKTFWTLSAWKDQESMMEFVNSGSHSDMLRELGGRLGASQFVESTVSSADLPLDWAAARQRLA